MMRRRELMGMQGVLKTVSGPIVTVNDAMARNAKSLVVNFAPVQASGTPSPDNVLPISGWTGVTGYRTGGNVWDEEWEVGSINDTTGEDETSSSRIRSKNYISCRPGIAYCFVSSRTGNDVRIAYYKADKSFIRLDPWQYNGAFTTPGEAYYMRFYMAGGYGKVYNYDISINYPATDTAYHPYSGTTYPVDWGTQVNKTISGTDGSIFTENGMSTTGYIAVNPGDVFVYTFTSSAAGRSRRIYGYDSSKAPVNSLAGVGWVNVGTTYTLTATIPSGVSYIRISFVTNDTDISIVESNSGVAYVIARQEIGTIYGGCVDLVSGVLVRAYGYAVLDGGANQVVSRYEEGSSGDANWLNVRVVLNTPVVIGADSSRSISSFLPYVYANVTTSPHYYISNNISIFLPKGDFSTVDAVKGWLSNNPQVVLWKRTPTPVATLTPQTVATLKGTNNVWANANGNTELTYYAQ